MATTAAALQNLALEWNVRDNPAVIAELAKQSGILQTATVAPANWGNKHKYKFWNSLPAGTVRQFGSGIAPVSLSKDMQTKDLFEISSILQGDAGEVDAHPGGMQGWFNSNINGVLSGLGGTASKQIIYGTELQTGTTYYASQNGFQGLAQYAVENGTFTEIDTNDSNTGAQSSIHVVRWDESTGASLRIFPNAGGNLITSEFLGKSLVVTSTTTNAQQPVYSWLIKCYMTLICPTPSANFMVCGFSHSGTPELPTAPQLDNAIDQCSIGGAGNIVMYCNLAGLNAIRALKYAKGIVDIGSTGGINNNVTSWNGVPVVLDTNISSTEYAALYA
jgi:hypothetical protein